MVRRPPSHPPLSPPDEVRLLESLISRARELESGLASLLHEVESMVDVPAPATMPNPRRAQQLLGTAHNALQGARGCLDRRLTLARAMVSRSRPTSCVSD
jgi:hypothetical protein